MAALFAVAVTILIAGWLWFYVARPILEGWGLIVVNGSEEEPAVVMLPAPPAAVVEVPSSLQTDGLQTPDRPTMAVPTQEKILDIFRACRAAGMKRDALSAPWRAAGLPFDNNLWSKAAPEEEPQLTPIAGRPTKAQFEHDPALAYEPPPR